MRKTREEKQGVVTELKDRFSNSDAVFVTDYRGLKVSDITDLRNRLRGHSAEYRVVKNTLTRLALQDTPSQGLMELVDGPIAVAFARGDVVEVAKTLKGFSEEFPALKLKGGVLGESIISAEDIVSLSKLPSREELLCKLVGILKLIPANLVYLLNSLPQKLVMTLAAIQREKGDVQGTSQ